MSDVGDGWGGMLLGMGGRSAVGDGWGGVLLGMGREGCCWGWVGRSAAGDGWGGVLLGMGGEECCWGWVGGVLLGMGGEGCCWGERRWEFEEKEGRRVGIIQYTLYLPLVTFQSSICTSVMMSSCPFSTMATESGILKSWTITLHHKNPQWMYIITRV